MEESETIQLEIARLQERLDDAIAREATAREREAAKAPLWTAHDIMHGRRILLCPPNLRDRYRYVPRRSGASEVRITDDSGNQVNVFFSDMCAFVDGIRAKLASEEIS